MNPMQLLQIRNLWNGFTTRHPKFPKFMNAVYQNGLCEGTVTEIQIRTPDGKEFASNLKVTKEDLELVQQMRSMR